MGQPDWLEDHDSDDITRRGRPRWFLFVAASLPWALIVGLLVLSGRLGNGSDPTETTTSVAGVDPADDADHAADAAIDAPPADPAPADPASPDAAPPTSASPSPGTPATSSDEPAGTAVVEVQGHWRLGPGLEEAASLAVVVARAWLTGLDPVLPLEGTPPVHDNAGYAEHVVVEAVEHPAAGAAVVTLLAIVLDSNGPDLEATVRRLAVPIAIDGSGPRRAGNPWELPPPSLDPVELEQTRLEEPELLLAAAEALDVAGLSEHTLVALHRTDRWPVLATVRGPDDGPDGDGSTVVWLREHVGGFVVAGTTLAGHPDTAMAPEPPRDAPADEPTDEPTGEPADEAADQPADEQESTPTGRDNELDHTPGEAGT